MVHFVVLFTVADKYWTIQKGFLLIPPRSLMPIVAVQKLAAKNLNKMIGLIYGTSLCAFPDTIEENNIVGQVDNSGKYENKD